jgi:predicted dehydrogenase
LINAVNFHNRLYPANIFIKDYVSKGNVGEVFSISGHYVQDWLLFDTDFSWRLNSKESGSTRAVADIGSHWMDLVEYMTGEKITEVFAEFKTVYPKRKKAVGEMKTFSSNEANEYELKDIDTEDIAIVMFRFSNGSIGNVVISQMGAGNKNNLEVFISGTKASVRWSLNDLENVNIGFRNQPNQVITKDHGLMKVSIGAIDYPAGHTEGFPDAIKQVFKQVYQQPENKNYANFEAGLRQMILCEKIFESAKTSKWVRV